MVMRKTILWLDDYFDVFGEVQGPIPTSDAQLKSDLSKRHQVMPDIRIISETSVRGFLQRLLDSARVAEGIKTPDETAMTYDALVIDIMIDNVNSIQVPKIDPTTRAILFDDAGNVTGWDKFSCDAYDVGLSVVKNFVRRAKTFDQVPIVLYTHRMVTRALHQEIREFENSSMIVGVSKAESLVGLKRVLEGFGV